MDFRLTDRVALVTGAGAGNGAAIATGLALAGAIVAVTDIDGGTAEQSAQRLRDDPERLNGFLRHVPMQRVGLPSELAGPAIFLASDAASYMTGSVVTVDGGYLTL